MSEPATLRKAQQGGIDIETPGQPVGQVLEGERPRNPWSRIPRSCRRMVTRSSVKSTPINGNMITVATHKGALINVDATNAVQTYQSVVLLVGEAVRMLGSYNAASVFQATVITRAKASPKLWPPDQ